MPTIREQSINVGSRNVDSFNTTQTQVSVQSVSVSLSQNMSAGNVNANVTATVLRFSAPSSKPEEVVNGTDINWNATMTAKSLKQANNSYK